MKSNEIHLFNRRILFMQIKKYLKKKRESPDLFHVSPVTDMQDLLNMQIQQTLPHNDENGSIVHIFRVRK